MTRSNNIGNYKNPDCPSDRFAIKEKYDVNSVTEFNDDILDDKVINFTNNTNLSLDVTQSFGQTVDFNLDTNTFNENEGVNVNDELLEVNVDDESNKFNDYDNCCRPLEYNEYMAICGDVFNSFRYNRNIKSTVCAFMINIKELITTGQDSIMNSEKDAPCLGLIQKIMKCYRERFTSSSSSATNVAELQLPPSNPNHGYYSTKRMRPNVEPKPKRKRLSQQPLSQQKQTLRKKQTKTCGYCSGPHVCNSRNRKDEYGPYMEGQELMKLLKFSPYAILDESKKVHVISGDISGTKFCKHMVIHTVHSICTPSLKGSINPDETIFCLTLLDSSAKPMQGYDCCYVEHESVIRYIYKNMDVKNRFLFSTIKIESVGPKFTSRNNSHVYQSLHLS